MLLIKEITFQEAIVVRHPVLRHGKPIESCFFAGDDLFSTKHFGIFENEKLIGVCSLFEQNPQPRNKTVTCMKTEFNCYR